MNFSLFVFLLIEKQSDLFQTAWHCEDLEDVAVNSKVLNGLWKKWKGRDLDCVHESSLATHPSLPPVAPHATHTPTSQTAYFVLQVRDLLSSVFLAWKIYLSIKLNADAASKWLWVTWRDKLQVWRRKGPDTLNHLTASFAISTKIKNMYITILSTCIQQQQKKYLYVFQTAAVWHYISAWKWIEFSRMLPAVFR